MTKLPSLAIGIITYQRKKQTLGLLRKLKNQLRSNDQIILIENGSSKIKRSDLSFLPKKNINFIQLTKKSIPASRNSIFQLAKENFDFLAYIDSDCIPSKNWVKEIKEEFQHNPNYSIIQGNITALPKANLYAQTTQLLFQLWQNKNTKNSLTKVLDTKNIFFKLSSFSQLNYFFNEKLTYASDIDLGYKLQKKGFHIIRSPKALIYHCERTSIQSFFKHRLRISLAYRRTNKSYPNFFHSAQPIEKIYYLFSNLKFPILKKIKIIILLQIIYFCTMIKLKYFKL
jgi:GT2 family glycosyltransferase